MSIRFLPCIWGSCVFWKASVGSSFNSDSSWAWRPKSWLYRLFLHWLTFQTLHEGSTSIEKTHSTWVFSAQNPLWFATWHSTYQSISNGPWSKAPCSRLPFCTGASYETYLQLACQTGQPYEPSMPMCLSGGCVKIASWMVQILTAEFWAFHLLDTTYIMCLKFHEKALTTYAFMVQFEPSVTSRSCRTSESWSGRW